MSFAKCITFVLSIIASASALPSSQLQQRAGTTETGQATFYDPAGVGACGTTNSASDSVAAVSAQLFNTFPGFSGGNPNTNPVCGKEITVTFQGKSVTAKVVDRCDSCTGFGDLDLSTAAFDALASGSLGKIGVSWVFD